MSCAPVRSRLAGAAVVLGLAVGGCTTLEDHRLQAGTEQLSAAASARETALVAEYLRTLEAFATSGPAEQAELAEHARAVAAGDPTIFNRLRHALVLAIPGHAASNTQAARDALGALLATPEMLLSAEIAIANVMRHEVDARLVLERENQRLAEQGARNGQGQVETLMRRVQTQAAENARLKQELAEALAKLEAVATLERNIVERRGNAERTP